MKIDLYTYLSLVAYGKSNAILVNDLCNSLGVSRRTIRKLRSENNKKNKVKIITCSKGYFIPNLEDKEEIKKDAYLKIKSGLAQIKEARELFTFYNSNNSLEIDFEKLRDQRKQNRRVIMIYQKIQEIRVKLIKMKLKKTGYNKFANFHYYQLEDFMPALTELMENNKITSNFSIIGENAILTLIDYEDNTSSIFQSPIADASIKGCTPVQSLGGVHTYLKRYLYQNAFEINDGDLLDASLGREEEDPLITSSTIKAILDLLKDLNKEEKPYRDFILNNYKKPLEELTVDEGAKEAAYLAESLKKKRVIKPKEFDI